MKKNDFKNEKGSITLFVLLAMLFFIIVVLTAFISASNNAINQEEYIATIKKTYEKDLENIDEIYAKITGKIASLTEMSLLSGVDIEIPTKWKTSAAYTVKENDGTIVSRTAYASTVYAVNDGTNNIIPIPYGFFYVGGTLSSGVVISDNEQDKNKYAGQTDIPNDLIGNQFVWIPCSTNEYAKINWGDAYQKNTWDTSTNGAEKTQIEKYGGFYIGRYEAGEQENNKPTSKANVIPLLKIDYTTAVTMSEKMYNTDYISSGLVTGTQWDMMLNWMSTEESNSDIKSNCTWGNFSNTTLKDCTGKYSTVDTSTGSISTWADNTTKTNRISNYTILTTASTEEVKKKNLYDVAGNLCEWTQECALTGNENYYVLRGGSYLDQYSNSPACYRTNASYSTTSTNYGFRTVLYIK